MSTGKRAQREQGGVLLAALVLIAIVPLLMLGVADQWSTRLIRARETELLFVGDQMVQALASYRDADPSGLYPLSLNDLVEDRRGLNTRHHLRSLYRDPMTNRAEWGLVREPDRRISGVYSLAPGAPFKQTGFAPRHQDFEHKKSYRAWVFSAVQPAS